MEFERTRYISTVCFPLFLQNFEKYFTRTIRYYQKNVNIRVAFRPGYVVVGYDVTVLRLF